MSEWKHEYVWLSHESIGMYMEQNTKPKTLRLRTHGHHQMKDC
jgi:hypothetical protein